MFSAVGEIQMDCFAWAVVDCLVVVLPRLRKRSLLATNPWRREKGREP